MPNEISLNSLKEALPEIELEDDKMDVDFIEEWDEPEIVSVSVKHRKPETVKVKQEPGVHAPVRAHTPVHAAPPIKHEQALVRNTDGAISDAISSDGAISSNGAPVSGAPGAIKIMHAPPPVSTLPYTLSTYLQIIFNSLVLSFILFFAYTINCDVTRKINERTDKLIRDAQWCQEQYLINRCHRGAPPHLIETKKCLNLEHCMETDPFNVRRVSMYASLFAEVLNELTAPIEFKNATSIVSAVVMCTLVVLLTNLLFSFIKKRTLFKNTIWK